MGAEAAAHISADCPQSTARGDQLLQLCQLIVHPLALLIKRQEMISLSQLYVRQFKLFQVAHVVFGEPICVYVPRRQH